MARNWAYGESIRQEMTNDKLLIYKSEMPGIFLNNKSGLEMI